MSYFILYKATLILTTKTFSEIDIIYMLSSFSLTVLILCNVCWRCFSTQTTCHMVPPLLLFSSTYSIIRIKQTSYRGFSRRSKEASPFNINLILHSAIYIMSFHLIIPCLVTMLITSITLNFT